MHIVLDPDDRREVRGDLFALYRDLGIAERERHRLQHAVTGCACLRLMTHDQHSHLLSTLREVAAKPTDEQQQTLRGLLLLGTFDYQGDCYVRT